MPHPASRVLALLELLQAHHGLGGRELAERLGVDERTVRRYAATLAELGIPVTAARGRYGGYRLRPGYKLPPLMFTDEEAVAVVLGLLVATRLGLPGAEPAAGSAAAKLHRVLPAALAERVTALTGALELTLRRPRAAAPADTGTLLTLGQAVAGHRRVRLAYRSWKGADSRRDFDPYGLVFHSGRWYATGLDHASGQVRTFRVDRVRAVESRPESFAAPAGFDPAAQVVAGLSEVPYAHRVEVRLDTDLAGARREIPPGVATLTEVDGGVLLRTRAERLDGMARMMAGWSFGFTVYEPPALRDELARHAQRLAHLATLGPP